MKGRSGEGIAGEEVRENGRIQGCFVSILRLCMR